MGEGPVLINMFYAIETRGLLRSGLRIVDKHYSINKVGSHLNLYGVKLKTID